MLAVTSAVIRDPFISPAHLSKPECWPLLEMSIYEGEAYLVMSQFLTLGANGKTLKLCFLF